MTTPALVAQPSLLEALSDTEAAVTGYFGSLEGAIFARQLQGTWSPAEHLDHLNIAVSAVARGFGMSPWILRIRFGSSKRQSRTYEELRADYQARLAAGGRASGRFVPVRETTDPADAEMRKTDLLARWGRVNERLRTALSGWSERNLDRIQFPHPVLGKITARELACFTIYHGHHHVAAVQRRLAS
jgi:hypothetical protein